jgi:hypothetical protein
VLGADNRRIDLRHMAGFYCSHLINLGFSSAFLLRKIDEFFFERARRRVTKAALGPFFRACGNGIISFVVCTAVDKNFGRYLGDLSFRVYPAASTLPVELRDRISQQMPIGATRSYLVSVEQARDEESAIAQVETTLGSARALTFVVPHDMACEWEPAMYVRRRQAAAGMTLQSQSLPLQRAKPPPSALRATFRSLKSYSGRVLQNFDEPSTERILNSLSTSALARTSTNVENQLVSLWSAIEVLLSEPPRNTVRIVHYADLLSPCICLRYIRRQIVAVYNEMLVIYKGRFRRSVAEELSGLETDQHTKFAAILLLE